MQNELSKSLRAARALISEPGTNCKFVGTQHNRGLKTAYCAEAALIHTGQHSITVPAVFAVLKRRFEADTLPTPTYSGGGNKPIPWASIFDNTFYRQGGEAIAQFNNSTDQEQVLALFDEAIADAEGDEGDEGDEGHPAAPAAPEKPQPETPPTPKPEPAQPAARQRVLELA